MRNNLNVKPQFDRLTPLGVEMLKNMGDYDYAKLWIDSFAMDMGQDQVELAFLIALLEAISDKVREPCKKGNPEDFILSLQRRLLRWTIEFEEFGDSYAQALKAGNFSVNNLIEPKAGNVVEESEQKESAEISSPKSNSANEPFSPDVLEAARAIHILLNNKATPVGLFDQVGDYVADMRTDLMSAQGGETVEYIAEGLAHAQKA